MERREEEIRGFHNLCRTYFIMKLNKILDTNIALRERVEFFMEKHELNLGAAFKAVEEDSIAIALRKRLTDESPYWYIKKHIFEVILGSIESLEVKEFQNVEEMKRAVEGCCHPAVISDRVHFDVTDLVKDAVCQGEKDQFLSYLESIGKEDCIKAAQLFYRRVLRQDEIIDVKNQMEAFENSIEEMEKNRICFSVERFEKMVSMDTLKTILKALGNQHIYEINTGGIDSYSYEIELEALNPYYVQGFNIHWTSNDFNWSMTKNHEGYYFFYGEHLIREIKKFFLNWKVAEIEVIY